uniref:Uncharacterized protein n=1 Tax=Aegilops tauschii TaxID=37682 RepID=M8BHN7_AEGTA
MPTLLVIQVRRYTTSVHGFPAPTPLFSTVNPVSKNIHDLVVDWDRDGAESGEVAGPGEEGAEGGAAAEPQDLTTQAQVRLGKMLADAYIATL